MVFNVDGNRIREARKNLGLSQQAVADKIGVSKVTICWYESGERTPSLEKFLKLAEALNLSLDELVGQEINVVAEDETDYHIKLNKKDIEIITILKEKSEIYKKLYTDPKRTIELIERKLK